MKGTTIVKQSMSDEEFAEWAKHASLTEQEASTMLRYQIQTRLWLRTFKPDDPVRYKLILSQAVENRRQAKAAERTQYLRVLCDFLAKLRS